jgi:hypothetical protein
MKAFVVTIVSASALAGITGSVHARHEPSTDMAERVTLLARPLTLSRGQALTLYGSVDSQKAEELVTIEARDCGQTSFREVASARTHAGGGWSTGFNPGITATLRAVWNGSTSTPITVRDRVWVQLERGPRSAVLQVAVRAKLQFWRRHVLLQRFDRRLGTWTTVKKVVLTETGAARGSTFVWSSAEFGASVPKGTLVRALFPLSQARPCYLEGYSNLLRT